MSTVQGPDADPQADDRDAGNEARESEVDEAMKKVPPEIYEIVTDTTFDVYGLVTDRLKALAELLVACKDRRSGIIEKIEAEIVRILDANKRTEQD